MLSVLVLVPGMIWAGLAPAAAQSSSGDPDIEYLSQMCLPLFNNATRAVDLGIRAGDLIASLANSPFPCEQAMYLEAICIANGTEEVDFLAEQQCLCNGAYFEVAAGCSSCRIAHGSVEMTEEEAASSISSISAAECTPSPPYQPFTNLFPPVNVSTIIDNPPNITLGTDRFPNDTAVSNYFTPTQSPTPGEITGSATARLTSWTNTDGSRYTPTTTPPSSSPSASPTESPSPTGNGVAKSQAGGVGCLLAAGVGLIALL